MGVRFIGPLPKCTVKGCKNPVRRHFIVPRTGPNTRCAGHIQRTYNAKRGYTKLDPDGPLLKPGRPFVYECRWCGGPRDKERKRPFCSDRCERAKKTDWQRTHRQRTRLDRSLAEVDRMLTEDPMMAHLLRSR